MHSQDGAVHADRASHDTELPRVALRIGAERLYESSQETYTHSSPVTGLPQASFPLAGTDEVRRAVAQATTAASAWAGMRPEDRRSLFLRLSEVVGANADEFARINVLETGTPVALGATLVRGAADWIAYYAGWIDKLEGTVHNSVLPTGSLSYSHPEPYGVVGVIFPWNNPIASLGMKVIPALAAGNAVVVKPSELAPFAVEHFARLCDQVGFPPGVLNVVPGTGEAGKQIVQDPGVQLVSFTGGSETGKKILESCAAQLKPTIMELGGKSPHIVFDDADADRAAAQIVRSLSVLSGQACVFGSRVLVQDEIYDTFIDKLGARAAELVGGDPADPRTAFGPVISEEAQARILGVIERSVTDGGRLVAGGSKLGGDLSSGHYVAPTIIDQVGLDAEISQEETFGPVLTVYRFSTEEQAVGMANSTAYGLGAYVQTSNIARALRVSSQLKSGGVYINGGPSVMPNLPFGGIGESGFGREGGRPGIEEYLRLKTVSIGSIR